MKIAVTHKLTFESAAEAYDHIRQIVQRECFSNYYEVLSSYIKALADIESGNMDKIEDFDLGLTIVGGDET